MLALAIAASVVVNVYSYIAYERDWLKQSALVLALRDDQLARSSRFILIEDETLDLDVSDRMFYEWTGMLEEAYGDESRYAVRRVFWGGDFGALERHVGFEPYYSTGEFAGGLPDCIVRIEQGDADLRRTWRVIWYMVLDWVDRDALYEELRETITIASRPYTAADLRTDTYPPLIR
jgi:hypothetical protein